MTALPLAFIFGALLFVLWTWEPVGRWLPSFQYHNFGRGRGWMIRILPPRRNRPATRYRTLAEQRRLRAQALEDGPPANSNHLKGPHAPSPRK